MVNIRKACVLIMCALTAHLAHADQTLVKNGENIADVAKRCNVSIPHLVEQNNLAPPFHLFIDQPLNFRKKSHLNNQIQPKHSARSVTLNNYHAQKIRPVFKAPKAGRNVQPLYVEQDIEAAYTPPQHKPKRLAAHSAVAPPRAPQIKKTSVNWDPIQPQLKPRPGITGRIQLAKQDLPVKLALADKEKNQSSEQFLCPLKGRIQPSKDNRFVTITTTGPTSAVASAAGKVALKTSNQGAEGLIIIEHENNWSTTYAHNGQAKINDSDTVSVGQKIISFGSKVATPYIRFEVRHNGKTVDPDKYIS